MVQHANIHEAKVAVMGAVEYVQKTGKMEQGARYKYVTVDEVIAKLRPAMVEHGIHFAPTQMQIMHQENYTTNKGTQMTRVILGVGYRLSHISGSYEDGFAVGEGSDSGDKACNKAMTAAKKYALLQSFCLETGEDDPDHEPSAEQERKPQANGNGKSKPPSDPLAVAREEYKAKLHGYTKEKLVEALTRLDSEAGAKTAAEKFGKDGAAEMREATVAQLYKTLEIAVGGLQTYKVTVDWEAWCAKNADKFLSEDQKQQIEVRLARHRENLKEDLEKAQRQTA